MGRWGAWFQRQHCKLHGEFQERLHLECQKQIKEPALTLGDVSTSLRVSGDVVKPQDRGKVGVGGEELDTERGSSPGADTVGQASPCTFCSAGARAQEEEASHPRSGELTPAPCWSLARV